MTLQGVQGRSGLTLLFQEGSGKTIQTAKFLGGILRLKMYFSTVPPFLPCTCTHPPASHTSWSCPKKSGEITIQLSNSSIQRSALACSMQADFSPQKQAIPPTLDFFSWICYFQTIRTEMKDDLIYFFFPSFCSCLAYFILYCEHPGFLQYHSLLGKFIFLKVSKPFSSSYLLALLLFSQKFKSLSHPSEASPLATKDSQPFTSPEDLLTGQSSHLAAPCSGFCLLWHFPDILLGIPDSPPTAIAYLTACFHHTTCAAFCSPRSKSST